MELILLLYERSCSEVLGAGCHRFEDAVAAATFDLDHVVLHAGFFAVPEDCVESYHTALSYFLLVLDMEHGPSAGIFLEVIYRTGLAYDSPIHVHLEEYAFRICVLEHVIEHNFAFDLYELVRVVVISELYSFSRQDGLCVVHYAAEIFYLFKRNIAFDFSA